MIERLSQRSGRVSPLKWRGLQRYQQFPNHQANGKMVWQTGTEFTSTRTARDTKATGKTIYSKASGSKFGRTGPSTREITASVNYLQLPQGKKNGIGVYRWPDNTVYEGQWKDVDFPIFKLRETWKARGNAAGTTAGSTKVSGKTTVSTGTEVINFR